MKTWVSNSGIRIIQVLAGRSNVFLITNDVKNILIDTSPKYRWKKLEKKLKNLNISKIDTLILTHTHFDHASNSKKIKNKFNARVIVHRNESTSLLNGNKTLPKGTFLITRMLINIIGKKIESFIKYESCQSDIIVNETYQLNDLGSKSYILHTPGHSDGSMSIIVDNEIAIVGDALFGIFGWSVFPPFADNTDELIKSWKKLLDTESKIFLPAHGTVVSRRLLEKCFLKEAKT